MIFERIRRMFKRPDLTPPATSTALEVERKRHKELLTRADKTVQKAMAHADEVFGPTYRGPERRSHPR